MDDPVPPGHGEPENVGARPSDYCPSCFRPLDYPGRLRWCAFCRRAGAGVLDNRIGVSA